MFGEALSGFGAVDHRRDHRRGACVGGAARGGEIVKRHAHDRGLPGVGDGENCARRAGEVDAAVLHVERHGVKVFARQRFGDK